MQKQHFILALALSSAMMNAQANTQQVPGYYHQTFGEYRITALLDGTNYISACLFKDLGAKQTQQILQKYYVDQAKGIQTSVNAFLIKTPQGLILVDSGAASCFGSHLGSVAKNLQAAGYALDQVKTVLLTHLHPDHVCGISQQGHKVFPNATIYVHEREADFWLSPNTVQQLAQAKQQGFLATQNMIKAAIAPYQSTQQFRTFKDGSQIESLKVRDSRGHTPGHHSFSLQSGGNEMVFIGDIVHSHSLQFDAPKTAIEYDIDPQMAVATRLKMFAEIAGQGKWVAAPHLPFPGIGHIYRLNTQQYQWIPVHFNDVLNPAK